MKWKYCLNNINLIHSHPCNPCPKMEIPILLSYSPKFEDIEACLRATHRQAWLVTRDSFKWGKVCHIPLWAFLLLSMEE
jgi:hypothetical protein